MIVQNSKIASAASYLPLSDSAKISKSLGTRHRAAVGISEVSDAFTIVVSEETGSISVTLMVNYVEISQLRYLKNY